MTKTPFFRLMLEGKVLWRCDWAALGSGQQVMASAEGASGWSGCLWARGYRFGPLEAQTGRWMQAAGRPPGTISWLFLFKITVFVLAWIPALVTCLLWEELKPGGNGETVGQCGISQADLLPYNLSSWMFPCWKLRVTSWGLVCHMLVV